MHPATAKHVPAEAAADSTKLCRNLITMHFELSTHVCNVFPTPVYHWPLCSASFAGTWVQRSRRSSLSLKGAL